MTQAQRLIAGLTIMSAAGIIEGYFTDGEAVFWLGRALTRAELRAVEDLEFLNYRERHVPRDVASEISFRGWVSERS